MNSFPGKLAIQQRVLTPYRAAFFDLLAPGCAGGLSVFAGRPLPEESIAVVDSLHLARFQPARNLHLFRGPLLLCHQRGLLRWLREWDPDLLVAEANPRDISTPAALRWMKGRRRPVVGWGLGFPPPASLPPFAREWGTRRLASFLAAWLRCFDALVTYSRRGAEQYASLGFPASRIFIAPNAAAPLPAHPLPIRPIGPGARPCLLFVGRLQARKRIDSLLRACASLPSSLQPRLVIVGDGPERPALERLAREVYPLAEFPGARQGPDLAPFFQEADLFVLPGTGGLAVQEAMSWGLPIIMGRGDGTGDDLVRPENGWLVPDPSGLGEVLRLALADVPRLRRMGAASYDIVAREINLERMAAAFLSALEAVSAPGIIR